MIDVSGYLPFEDDSTLARTGSSFKLTKDDDLPVLDGAAALVPVYASIIDECYPDAENIRNGLYPVMANSYVVYRKDNDNPNIERLVDWILSDEGQRLIEACGYVGL